MWGKLLVIKDFDVPFLGFQKKKYVLCLIQLDIQKNAKQKMYQEL